MKTKAVIILLVALTFSGRAFAISIEEARSKIRDLAKNSDLEKAIALGDQAIAELPDDYSLLIIHGTNLVSNCQAAKAIPFLEKATRIIPQTGRINSHSRVFVHLAQAHFQLGNYKEASNCLNIAGEHPDGGGFVDDTINKYGFSAAYKLWFSSETEHIRFHFSPAIPPGLRRKFAETREAAFKSVNAFFNAPLPKKIDFFVWTSSEEAQQKADIGSLGFAITAPAIIHSRPNQSRGHEIAHVLTCHAFRPRHVTRFVNEGVAVYFDLNGTNRLATAREAVGQTNSKSVSILSLWTEKSGTTQENLLYPVAGALIERLHQKGGDEKLRRLCTDQSYEAAKSIYGEDLGRWIAELEAEINSN